MNITKESIDKLNARVTIKLEPADYQPTVDSVLKDHARKANMPGFRPGKVPVGVVKKMYGTSVLVDRYAFSGVAFTAAKGLDLEWCKNPDRGLPKPDLVLQLDVDEETAKKRGGFGEERYEKVEFQRQVRKLYSQLREEHSDVSFCSK